MVGCGRDGGGMQLPHPQVTAEGRKTRRDFPASAVRFRPGPLLLSARSLSRWGAPSGSSLGAETTEMRASKRGLCLASPGPPGALGHFKEVETPAAAFTPGQRPWQKGHRRALPRSVCPSSSARASAGAGTRLPRATGPARRAAADAAEELPPRFAPIALRSEAA